MWFKQISFYPLNKDKLPELETLADKLGESEFARCQGLEWFSEGFAAPVPFSPELVFPADYTWRVALKKEEKVLPAGVIRDILDDKVLEIQNNEARNVGRKEKQELKEQITDDLLPRAFTRSSRTQAIFDTRRGFLLVNNAASAKAENVLTKLREALGGLEASLPNTKQSPSGLMTSWLLNGHCEGGFRDPTGLGVARTDCVRTDAGLYAQAYSVSGRIAGRGGDAWRRRGQHDVCLADSDDRSRQHHAGRAGVLSGRLAGLISDGLMKVEAV